MYTLFIVLALISAFFLVIVVLAQNSKGGGLSNQFGGSGASNLIGVKKTGDLLERLTWIFAIAIMVFSLATNFTNRSPVQETDELLENVGSGAALPAAAPKTAPATVAPVKQTPATPKTK